MSVDGGEAGVNAPGFRMNDLTKPVLIAWQIHTYELSSRLSMSLRWGDSSVIIDAVDMSILLVALLTRAGVGMAWQECRERLALRRDDAHKAQAKPPKDGQRDERHGIDG